MSARARVGAGRAGRGSAVLVTALGLFGCDTLLTDPAPATPEVAVSFAVSGSSAGGVADAFNRVNRAMLRFTRADGAQRDTVVRVSNENGVARARLILETQERIAALGVYAELWANTAPLFSGARVIRVENGTVTSAEIALTPVPAALRADRAGVQFQHVGDTTRLASAVLFASGDTIPGLAGTWTSENAEVVFVTPAGLALGRHVGETRLFVTYGPLADTVTARVVAERSLARVFD